MSTSNICFVVLLASIVLASVGVTLTSAFRMSFHFLWFDAWIGVFYDRAKRTVYICPLPMVVIKLEPRT